MAVPERKSPQQLVSSLSLKGSDDDVVVYCQPCDRDGQRLAAHGYCINCCEHLCESCFNHDKKQTLSRDHILKENISMPLTLQSPLNGHSQRHDKFVKHCPKHKKETIKYFCHDHKALIFHVCVTLEHQSSSCSVKYIPNISENVIDENEYQELLKTMQNISNRFQEKKDNVNKASQKSNNSLKKALRDIKIFRKEINQRIDELEKQIKDRVKYIQYENSINLRKIEATCNDASSRFQTSSDSIKQLNEAKRADDLFIEVKCAEKMIKDYERELENPAKVDIIEYDFKLNETISNLLTKEKSLGTLVHKTTKIKKNTTKASEINFRPFSYNEEIYVKTSKDRIQCWITGIVVLTPDFLVIADCYNKALKLVNTSSKFVTDQLQLVSGPYSISTITTDTKLAVTLPDNQKIQFILATTNKLTELNTIKVDGECYGISYHQGKFVVSFCFPSKLQILDMEGTVLTTFGENYFHAPIYVVSNNRSIYVSDRLLQKLTRLNWQREVVSIYGGMNGPKGIALSDDGTIFGCDKNRNVIEEISGDCSTGKVVLKDLKRPQILCWCPDTRKLYYSSGSVHPKDGNVLHVYKLS